MPPRWALPVAAFVSTFALANLFGFDIRGTRHALELTARFSYLWFWVAYAGCSLATLLRIKFAYGREFGLAFAASHSVHLFLVIWLYRISPSSPTALFGVDGAIFGAIGFALMYVLVILSIRRITLMMSYWVWRTVMFIGMEYIAFAFLSDFWPKITDPLTFKFVYAYLPFILLGLLGTSLRVMRWTQQARVALA